MLSTRLQFIYEQLEPGFDVWDLCCDHGYLGIVAFKSKKFQQVHFVDQAAHLVEALRARWATEADTHFYPCTAEAIDVPLTGNVVIAGVGGQKITEILLGLQSKGHLKARRLVLVPHKDEEAFEHWLELWVGQWIEQPTEHSTESRLQDSFVGFRLDQRLSVKEGPRVRRVFVLNSINDSRVV